MIKLQKYIEEVLGVDTVVKQVLNERLTRLPLYLLETYHFYKLTLFDTELICIKHKDLNNFKVSQTYKNTTLIKNTLKKCTILIITELEAYNRKRLIAKGVNFIVPTKQMFIPDLLISLKEGSVGIKTNNKVKKLLPSAQFLLLFHIYNYKTASIEECAFKHIAELTKYSSMAITKAVNNLKYHKLITINGTKEKYIKFNFNVIDLWKYAEKNDLLINPITKSVFVDEIPKDVNLFLSNSSALAKYSDMSPERQDYYAINKVDFYNLKKNTRLLNLNNTEGKYCLEVWKYSPIKTIISNKTIIDALSLYLSLKDNKDERVEMALEKVVKNTIIEST